MPLLNSGSWNSALHPRDSNGEFRYNGGGHRLKSGARGASDVVGTVFGGPYDPNRSFYTGKAIDPDQLGAALPFKFSHVSNQLPGV